MGLIIKNLAIDTDQDILALDALELSPPPSPELVMDDPVARACASWRHWKQTGHMWTDLDTVTVTGEDRAQAQELKRYYRETMILQALRGVGTNASEFRRKLGALVTDQLVITRAELGLLHRLPYLYQEDLTLDRVVAATVNPSDRQMEWTGVFALQESLLRSRRSATSMQYWLTMQNERSAFLLAIAMDNPLRAMWESLIKQPRHMTVRAHARSFPGHRSHRWYHQIHISGVTLT